MKSLFALAALILPLCVYAQSPDTASKPRVSAAMLKSDTIRTPSGLTVIFNERGSGKRAREGNLAIVHYTGKLADGRIFDSSIEREPFAFRIGRKQVIKGWDEGIAMLRIGDKATLIIPPDLGYGAKGAGDRIPPNSQLIFTVELVDLKRESVGEVISANIDKLGIEKAEKLYQNLKSAKFKGHYLGESELNRIGYEYLGKEKYPEAIAVFKMNVDAFPNSGNVYDSLGEAYMKAGDKVKAIANYKRSLEIDPKNTNAVEMLKKLNAK